MSLRVRGAYGLVAVGPRGYFPINTITAHAVVEERQKAVDAGVNDHISMIA